ncbi:MAG: hypothetical protein JNL62_14900 [Bryobacterales bacterium]|nr:hypothetical protein [Bryobacterales bacterium]
MRLVLVMLVVGFVPAFSQQRGMYGGVSTGQMVGSINSTGFASGLGATVSSLPQTGRVIPMGPGVYSHPVRTPGNNWSPRGARTMAIPWGLPITTGYVATVPEYVPVPVPQPQVQPAPSVIINQYYSPEQVRPQMKEYDDLPEARLPRTEVRGGDVRVHPPAPKTAPAETSTDSSKPTITLLAFKDSSVIAAIAYWEQAEQLHFVTNSFAKKIVPVGSLDNALSEQLNKERKVDFKLESMR